MLLLASLAAADPLFVAGARVAAGLAPDGSLCASDLALCLLWDPPGDVPMGDDLLWPGYAYEILAASYASGGTGHTFENGAPYTGSDLTFAWDVASGPDVDVLVGTATTEGATWEVRAEAPWDGDVVWLTVTVTADAPLSDVAIARMVDADIDYGWNGDYSTDNAVGDGWVSAAGAWDGRALALAAEGGEGFICSWCTSVADARAGSGSEGVADAQLALVVEVGDLPPGESATVRFAYGFGMDAGEAVDGAVAAAADADHDDDGVDAPTDCDDADADVFPGAIETTDGRDEDCDGEVDEASAGVDDDGDGYTEADGDCDDTDPAVHPGADPVEGVPDADCDGVAEGRTDTGADSGGDTDADTGADTDGAPDGGADSGDKVELEGGCACDTGGGSGGGLGAAVLIGALLARRRRA